ERQARGAVDPGALPAEDVHRARGPAARLPGRARRAHLSPVHPVTRLVAFAIISAFVRLAYADDHLTREQCTKQKVDVRPGAPLGTDAHVLPTTPGGIDAPIPWSDLAIDGKFVEDATAVRALLAPTIQRYRTTLTPA